MRILVTGSRGWSDARVVARALLDVLATTHDGSRITVVHGACPTGADAIADSYARQWGWDVDPHPADWERHRKAAGPLRNAEMVQTGADICLAFLTADSRGTRNCARLAREAGIPVKEFHG